MKKTKIEKFIFENKENFNQLKAPTGLWDKIEQNLPKVPEKKATGRMILMRAMKVAAISISILISGIMIGKIYFSKNNFTIDPQVNQRIEKTENYYGTLISYKLDEARSQDLLDEKLLRHLDELDQEYADIKLRLNENNNINNEQLVNQMTKNYRLRLSLVELLLDRGKIKSLKTNNFNKKDTI